MTEKKSNIVIKEGTVYQSLSGFYYVWSDNKVYATKPKGVFRHQKVKPLVGDSVKFEIDLDDEQSEGRLIEIEARHNEMIRPPITNVEVAFVVMSLVEPDFTYNLLDYFLVAVESHDIKPIIVLTKYDLLIKAKGNELAEEFVNKIKKTYESIGYKVWIIDGSSQSYKAFLNAIEDKIHVVMGQSGVGKSTLLNQLVPELELETKAISESLNRGRHTTREVTLYKIGKGLVADTPGFSSLDFETIEKENLQFYFPEIRFEATNCRFRTCNHLNEPGCQVKKAVEESRIIQTRYDNYVGLYQRIENRKPVYRKKNK